MPGGLPQDRVHRAHVPLKPDTTNYSVESKSEPLVTCQRAFLYDAYEHNESKRVILREIKKGIGFTNELLVWSIELIIRAKKKKEWGEAVFIELIQHLSECEVAIDDQLMPSSIPKLLHEK